MQIERHTMELIVAFRNFASSLKTRFAVCRKILPYAVFCFEFVLLYNQSTERNIFSGLLYCLKILFIFNHSFSRNSECGGLELDFHDEKRSEDPKQIAKINAC